jgi:hypothetical protein
MQSWFEVTGSSMRRSKGSLRATPSSGPPGIRMTLRSTAYDAEPMVGAALGRLWDTHPKLAFVLHLLLTVYLGSLALWLFVTGATGIGVVLTIGFAVMAGSLVLFTWLEAQNGWQPDDSLTTGMGTWSVRARPGQTLKRAGGPSGFLWDCLPRRPRASDRQEHRRDRADPRGIRACDRCDADGLAGGVVAWPLGQ